MKKYPKSTIWAFILIFSLLPVVSCERSAETVSCFPTTSVNVVLNLNLPAYQNLQTTGGWMYIDEQNSGTRGLIIVRTGTGFKVYDRNAPHICPDSSTTLSVEENIKIVCPKDNATWILLTGQPTAVASVAPKTYQYDYNASTNILTVHH